MPAPSQSTPPYKLCPRCRLIYPAATNYCGRDREPLIADSRIIAGRYILLHPVGSGTMSEVYAAEQPQLGRKVAIKLLRRDLDVVRRFYSEVRAVGQIRHEHVVTIHDSGRIEDGRPYIAMEFLEGEDLASHLKKHGPMHSSRAMLLWRQAVSAVAATHRRHVVHRDIKPANLFLTYKEGDDGPEEIIKVIDFSIAKIGSAGSAGSDSRSTEPGAIVGTVLYMAPEQLSGGEASPRSDVYSLGLVLMEMLTGKLPWGGARGDAVMVGHALQRLVNRPSTLRELDPELPFSEELQQLASSVLSQEAKARPADAGELLRRIKRLPEMRDWQRLPRRLSWSGSGQRDARPEPMREPTAEVLTEVLSELQARKLELDEDGPTTRSVRNTDPDESRSAGESSWSSSASATEINDWTEEPTVPADGVPLEQHMRSLEVALLAESRRAQSSGIDFSGDTFLPVTRGNVTSADRAIVAPPREDSNSESKGNVFDADDLNHSLAAASQTLGEEPTLQSATSPLHERTPEPHLPLPPASRSPAVVVVDDLHLPNKSTERVTPTKKWTHKASTWIAVGLTAAFLFWLVFYRTAHGPDVKNLQPSADLRAAIAELLVPDAAVTVTSDGGAETSADLNAPPDLYDHPDGSSADAAAAADNESIRVRLFYSDDDGVTELSCAPQQGQPKTSTQRHRVTLRATLLPGAVCTVSGPGGTRTYTYEQLAKHKPQRSGEIRFHVQVRATAAPAPAPAPKPSENSQPPTHEPSPEPQAAEASEPVDGG